MNGVKRSVVDPSPKNVAATDHTTQHTVHEEVAGRGESGTKSCKSPSKDTTEVSCQGEDAERCQVPVEACNSSLDGGATIVTSLT